MSEMSVKPECTRMSLVVSAPAMENGPGPQVGSSYSSGFWTMPSTICWARKTQRLSSRRRQTTIASLPPGVKDLHTLRIAATGLMKNIVPMRENAMS